MNKRELLELFDTGFNNDLDYSRVSPEDAPDERVWNGLQAVLDKISSDWRYTKPRSFDSFDELVTRVKPFRWTL